MARLKNEQPCRVLEVYLLKFARIGKACFKKPPASAKRTKVIFSGRINQGVVLASSYKSDILISFEI
jgi:hypothetical protein